MNYEDAVAWVDGFHQFGIRLGLNRIEEVLDSLDNPHKNIDIVHVAGTNGKGSVCRFISSILSSEGYKTGLYLSPHLVDFRERFQLNDKVIEKKRFVEIVEQVQPVVEQLSNKDVQLTYFEVCTVIAFFFFAEEQVDYAIIEVGLGGRFDATNVITPVVSVITNVSLDHQQQLGDTIEEIALEKAGIIKPGIPVVTGAEGTALSVIRKNCEKQKCSLYMLSKENIEIQECSSSSQTILVHGQFDDYLVSTAQIGTYQALNIALSIMVIEVLQQNGVSVTKESILNGIGEMKHPGRMQILQYKPVIVVDGAHNVDAMKQLVTSIKNNFTFDRLIVIFGVMKDKAISEMLKEILPITDIVIVTEPEQKRSAKKKDIANHISKIDDSKQMIATNSVSDAYYQALEIATKKDLIVGTGSLFTVGELLQIDSQK
ncbi:MAG: bifunctional folylpolyglutamate synthase/dihydrofolate synthase [Candidatus Thermoplasmatota archaeon]|nr:bifunctional folylpolyglutamate synthase/dihydrofolate synthase [Candidatus Thermoplasmatota archaeon]